MKPIRVLLADDHALVRAGIRALVQNIEGVEVVGEAVDGREALSAIKRHQPDLVLMDISMAGLNGLEAASRVARDFPNVRVIILSAHSNEEYVCQALRAGASGYLLKDAGTSELDLAIKAVARGETYLSPGVSKHVIADYLRRTGGESGALELLTPRQREILQLIAEGQTTKQIANTLHISVKTVETHRMQLMERLDIHDVAGLVRFAVRMGLVKTD
ncbi:MAG TPA: response regulator transcription factor [Gemmataceae bacterium]|jgi:DNA-binding NarL/FixJ family response regulator|nr:response regulator transcription factor [Gemmataceae bacterium]